MSLYERHTRIPYGQTVAVMAGEGNNDVHQAVTIQKHCLLKCSLKLAERLQLVLLGRLDFWDTAKRV